MLKPVLTAGSEGLTLLPGGTGRDAALDDVLGLSSALSVRTDEVIVQERLHGTEYAVDAFTADGRHTTTSICRYRKVPNGDRFAVYESTDYLGFDEPGHDELIARVHAGLDALNIRFGFAHTEIMVTADAAASSRPAPAWPGEDCRGRPRWPTG